MRLIHAKVRGGMGLFHLKRFFFRSNEYVFEGSFSHLYIV